MAVLSCPECGGVEHQSRFHDLMCWACGHLWSPHHDQVSATPPGADVYDKKGALVEPKPADPTPPSDVPWVDPHAPVAGDEPAHEPEPEPVQAEPEEQ